MSDAVNFCSASSVRLFRIHSFDAHVALRRDDAGWWAPRASDPKLGETLMTPSIDVLALNSCDAGLLMSINELFVRVFEEPQDPLASRPGERYLAQLLACDTFIAVAALVDGHVVGGITGYLLPKAGAITTELYLYDLAVAANWRRHGVATAMIGRLRQVAREKGASVIFVQADLEDAPAIALYSRYGARRDVLHFEIGV
jgi:aminoglycoside 3-N-acetyltransferase I